MVSNTFTLASGAIFNASVAAVSACEVVCSAVCVSACSFAVSSADSSVASSEISSAEPSLAAFLCPTKPEIASNILTIPTPAVTAINGSIAK